MFKRTHRRVVVGIAALLMLSGAGGLFVAAQANAAGATLTATPTTGIQKGTTITASGSGFAVSSSGSLMECSNAPGQPTMAVAVAKITVPVSCSKANNILPTTASGTFTPTPFTVKSPVSGSTGTRQ